MSGGLRRYLEGALYFGIGAASAALWMSDVATAIWLPGIVCTGVVALLVVRLL